MEEADCREDRQRRTQGNVDSVPRLTLEVVSLEAPVTGPDEDQPAERPPDIPRGIRLDERHGLLLLSGHVGQLAVAFELAPLRVVMPRAKLVRPPIVGVALRAEPEHEPHVVAKRDHLVEDSIVANHGDTIAANAIAHT